MKKVILPLALLAGIVGTANAQTGIKYGVKGGFNGATFSGTDSKGSEYKAGFAAGVFANFGVADNFSIQPEVLYSQKGASVDNFQGVSGTTFKSTLGYLDVPIMLRVNAGDAGKGLFFELGPQGSFVLHNRDFLQANGNKFTDETTTRDLNKVMIGYVGGIGYQLTSGLSLGLRYTGDFSKAYKDGPSTTLKASPTSNGFLASNPSVHNSVFQFQVGYAFGGK
ncbi:porin family protein [Hymenobacter nivis]|uniref:PorT family protein n=1 Tax=Hymenobacter nivis TaxID=1850093 RepID=A0A502GMQ4_9BACT|nr:porin family protein [Hymenobacter nivis]TPG62266.1 PorT family protein [Hymenobacter nivis]